MTDRKRRTLTDARIFTVRISVPVDENAPPYSAIGDLVTYLPPGSTMELLTKRFGRMAVSAGNGQTSNSGADVDGKHEATKQSEDAPESDTAAPQGGGGNCGTTTSKDAPDINDDPMAAEREIYLRRQREPDPDTGTLTFPDIPPALDRRVPRPDA